MRPERRASERACDLRAGGGTATRGRRRLLLTLAATCAVGACRQTVILDPSENGDAASNPTGTGGSGGGGGSGNHFDGGRFDGLGFCLGGQIQPLVVQIRAPDVIFSVDRSAGMQSWFGGLSRLEVIQQQVHALVEKYGKSVRFGYEEFPSSLGMMCSTGQGCCAGSVTAPAMNNKQNIENALHACDGSNGGNANPCVQAQRPTADALAKCNTTFAKLNNTGRSRYVILLSGGEPTCGTGADPIGSACDNATTEILKLNNASIITAVFGVGDEARDATCLKTLAASGGMASPEYHLALTPNDLSVALEPVVSTMAQDACHLDVLTPPADAINVRLYLENMQVPADPVDGWSFDPGSLLKITINGNWCKKLIVSHDMQPVDLVAGSGCAPHP